jgi:hypothetical protein
MASALGEEGQLLALLCQPAEVQGCVNIPQSIQFWGIDSGIRHSVGGSDYSSVRVGAFMGLRIASEVEHEKKVKKRQRLLKIVMISAYNRKYHTVLGLYFSEGFPLLFK